MIIRKPYAFLIKNFRKIHIALLLISFFLAYKIVDINKFVNDFINLGIYDLYANPISHHITFFVYLSIIIMILGCLSLLLLLKHKNKPWKLYLIPLFNYIFLYFVLSIIKNFFKTYSITVDAADLRFARDLLFIFVVLQLPVVGIFIMRTFGLDIYKFNFNMDEEFLQLSEEDREEIEISIDVDINTFKRLYRRTLRNIGYFYKEHKFISRTVIFIVSFILLFNCYKSFFVTNKSYSENDIYNYDGFAININKTYVSDINYKGEVISNKNKFVVIDLSVTNKMGSPQSFDTSRFHLKTGNLDYSITDSTFAKDFLDLGVVYSNVKKIQSEDTLKFLLIYKVDKIIKNNSFVLFFQEKDSNNILRKFKLNPVDLSNPVDSKEFKLGDIVNFDIVNSDDISIDSYEMVSSFDYSLNKCSIGGCSTQNITYNVPNDKKVLILNFASNTWEADEFVSFLDNFVKIDYIDSDGYESEMNLDFAIKNNYYGKIAYLIVPNIVEASEKLKLHIKIRNREYYYILK